MPLPKVFFLSPIQPPFDLPCPERDTWRLPSGKGSQRTRCPRHFLLALSKSGSFKLSGPSSLFYERARLKEAKAESSVRLCRDEISTNNIQPFTARPASTMIKAHFSPRIGAIDELLITKLETLHRSIRYVAGTRGDHACW
jgi:hypothetical protein